SKGRARRGGDVQKDGRRNDRGQRSASTHKDRRMGRPMKQRAEFHVMGQPFDGEPLHYTASGLDYVYLLNGFHVEEDSDYGRIVTIEAPDDLHRAIGMRVVGQERDLKGQEFRFLRKQMGLRQQDIADQIGVDVQTIANY